MAYSLTSVIKNTGRVFVETRQTTSKSGIFWYSLLNILCTFEKFKVLLKKLHMNSVLLFAFQVLIYKADICRL